MLVLLRVDEPENLQIWQKNIDFGDGWTLKNLGFGISFGYCNTTNAYKVLFLLLLQHTVKNSYSQLLMVLSMLLRYVVNKYQSLKSKAKTQHMTFKSKHKAARKYLISVLKFKHNPSPCTSPSTDND